MNPRILIVDDDPDIRTILALRLARAGFEVATAADGSEGLAALQHVKPSGVVLDLLMPKLDGFDFLATLQRGQPSPPPVFVVTQADDAAVRERVHRLGAERLISKGDALGREFAESLARRLSIGNLHPLPTRAAALRLGLFTPEPTIGC
ncbi:MAG TPA: response regulator [Candidatus Kryptonia bacterium]|nr:response regulator [Candidatus Kryptonia bacterium]